MFRYFAILSRMRSKKSSVSTEISILIKEIKDSLANANSQGVDSKKKCEEISLLLNSEAANSDSLISEILKSSIAWYLIPDENIFNLLFSLTENYFPKHKRNLLSNLISIEGTSENSQIFSEYQSRKIISEGSSMIEHFSWNELTKIVRFMKRNDYYDYWLLDKITQKFIYNDPSFEPLINYLNLTWTHEPISLELVYNFRQIISKSSLEIPIYNIPQILNLLIKSGAKYNMLNILNLLERVDSISIRKLKTSDQITLLIALVKCRRNQIFVNQEVFDALAEIIKKGIKRHDAECLVIIGKFFAELDYCDVELFKSIKETADKFGEADELLEYLLKTSPEIQVI
ncbi:unnamed protein product [Blepharisma stoltei]|uniref:Uncharacterized protein n=1 Tax=Blepharisma stoltei TaxID=1481888 RepID=A0AAU9IZ46_9CILI|nr:unnamed protein product [Blepharisma stoltei]